MRAPLIGAVLGALVLGPGGRLAMRGVTLWEHRAHLLSVSGTLTVVAWGAGLGAAAGLLRVAIEAAFDRWAPQVGRRVRAASFVTACLAATFLLLTPWTLPRLVLFPPVVLGFLLVYDAAWRRWVGHRANARRSA